MTKRIDSATFKRIGRAESRNAIITRTADAVPQASASGRTLSFVFSDEQIDRDLDVVKQSGWVLDSYLKNPIILFGHDPSRPENVIGRASNVRVEPGKLIGDVTFAEASVNPTAETVFQLYKGKFLNAVSVGFIPLEFHFSNDEGREGGVNFIRQGLCEVSCVPVPANANALAIARSKGIDVSRIVPFMKTAAPAPRPGPSPEYRKSLRQKAAIRDLGHALALGKTNAEIRQLIADGWITPPANRGVAVQTLGGHYHEAVRRGLI